MVPVQARELLNVVGSIGPRLCKRWPLDIYEPGIHETSDVIPLAPTLRVSALDVAWDPSRAGFGTSRGLGPFTPMSRHACLKGFRIHSLASVDAVRI